MSFKISVVNKALLFLQWILIALPLPGYIHPDEYFQSTEIMAADILGVKGGRTWEWNNSQPSRNILFPGFSAGLPFFCLRFISTYLQINLNPYAVLIAPRILMGLLTLATESVLTKLTLNYCKTKNELDVLLFLFRSSHVTLCFLNRTFSNSMEIFLFSLILFVTMKPEAFLKSLNLQILLGLILPFAFFVRQTIIAFCVFPLLRVAFAVFYEWNFKRTIKMVLIGGFSATISLVLCLFADKYYFSNGDDWPFTPVNLIKYNQNVENLKGHGLHPWYLHSTVNMILLFGPLHCLLVYSICRKLISVAFDLGSFQVIINWRSYFLLATIIPLCVLSLVAHQEPRYILPLLVPLICYVLVMFPDLLQYKAFLLSWIVFNSLGLLWFGFLHQAGLLPSLLHLHKNLGSSDMKTNVIFWKTYSVPRHLLLLPIEDSNIKIQDLAGSDWEILETQIRSMKGEEIYLVCPSLFHHQIKKSLVWKEKHSFSPHVSGEDLPLEQFVEFVNSIPKSFDVWMQFFKESFSLNVYHNVSLVL